MCGMMKQGGSGAKEGNLASFKFKAKENGTSNFTIDGELYNKSEQLIQTEFKEFQIQIGKEESKLEKEVKLEYGENTELNNSYLKSLRIDKEGMTPNFEKDIYEYDITISSEINEIEVLAIAENKNATVEVTDNTSLKEELNFIKIKVISEDKTKENIYTIQVTKTANTELANTNLETLAIENVLLIPPFESNKLYYKAEISNEITSLNLLAIPENEKATVKITGKDNLKEGKNQVIVTVTAENKVTKREYEISVYKRTQEEEKKYLEKQNLKQEALEQAYEIEKTSARDIVDEEDKKKGNIKSNISIWIVVGSIIIIASIIIIIWHEKLK